MDSRTRRAKIVCTLGPATSTAERIRALVDAGMDVARLNLSHGSYEEHAAVYAMVRAASHETGKAIAVLVDLQGPKIRLGDFDGGSAQLVAGEEFTVTVHPCLGTAKRASTTYAGLAGDARVGERVLIDDGRVVLEVVAVQDGDVRTRVIVGGRVSDHKGLNLPNAAVSVPAMSEKDIADLRWALKLRADLIALSFVRSADDLGEVLEVMNEEGVRLPVLAKIEKPQAIRNLDEIVAAFDGIMVARGDLGVEMPLEEVPIAQKRMISAARDAAKPVIVATQMLESMCSQPRPTRAEASDVANAVLDGADALMLSGETSIGDYPIESVATMSRIIAATESQALDSVAALRERPSTTAGGIARAATLTGATLGAAYLVAFTSSGETARRLARHRCVIPLLVFTPEPATRNQLALTWGVDTFIVPTASNTDEMLAQVDAALLQVGRSERGDLVVIVFGSPMGRTGSTNTMRLHRVGGV